MSKQKKNSVNTPPTQWVKMRNKLSHFCEAYAISQASSPTFWATVYTYGDGDFLYKFGRRITGNKTPDKVYVYYSDGHTFRKNIGDSYNTLAKAQKACLEHIARVVSGKANRVAEMRQKERMLRDMEEDAYHDFGYRGRNKYGYDDDDCIMMNGSRVKMKPLTRREKLDDSAESCISREYFVSNEHYIIEPEPLFEVKFGKVDKYGERHTHIEGLRLPVENISCRTETLIHIWLKIDGVKQRFHMLFHDAGTIGYARMAGGRAIGGRLTNISIEWGKRNSREIKMPHIIGTTDYGVFSGCIWYCASRAKSKRHDESRKRKEAGKKKPRSINAMKRTKANEQKDIEATIALCEKRRKAA